MGLRACGPSHCDCPSGANLPCLPSSPLLNFCLASQFVSAFFFFGVAPPPPLLLQARQADSLSTLPGRLPSYRSTLLRIIQRLEVPCSSQLATNDLEAEIILHLEESHRSGAGMDVGAAAAPSALAKT